MGGTAYSYVYDIGSMENTGLFAGLAAKFTTLVDARNDISKSSNLQSNSDLLRIYDVWLKTGSPRAYGKLQRLGLNPSTNATSCSTH